MVSPFPQKCNYATLAPLWVQIAADSIALPTTLWRVIYSLIPRDYHGLFSRLAGFFGQPYTKSLWHPQYINR